MIRNKRFLYNISTTITIAVKTDAPSPEYFNTAAIIGEFLGVSGEYSRIRVLGLYSYSSTLRSIREVKPMELLILSSSILTIQGV